jgi:hypothetical protein
MSTHIYEMRSLQFCCPIGLGIHLLFIQMQFPSQTAAFGSQLN